MQVGTEEEESAKKKKREIESYMVELGSQCAEAAVRNTLLPLADSIDKKNHHFLNLRQAAKVAIPYGNDAFRILDGAFGDINKQISPIFAEGLQRERNPTLD